MNSHAPVLLLALLALAPCIHAAENPRCIEEYKAEVARIGREAEMAAKANPPPKDIEGQRQYMIPIERAMRAAAEKADQCERAGRDRPKDAATVNVVRAQQCADDVDRQLTTLQRRYNGNMPSQEREALRAQEKKLENARADCMRQAR